ncbi:MAG: UbiD family decarboxylase [Propionibacteriales bacterium]|nr:UbiD family decarboxylase [Propionibacteriales bacterium]
MARDRDDAVGRWPHHQSLRAWLARQDEAEELIRINRQVNTEFEIAGLLRLLDGQGPVLFESVAGSALRVVGSSAPNRAAFAAAADVPVDGLLERYMRAEQEPRPLAQVVDAPVFEHTETDGLASLPIPTHHELDAGAYISAGVVLARDPDTGATNCSINRLQVVAARELRALVLPGRLSDILARCDERAQPLEVAVLIGVDPLLHLASQASTGPDMDELQVASALRATPLPVAHGKTVDLPIPADTEIVIEGHVLPGERRPEGPFGEYPRTYGPAAPGRVIEVRAIHRRHDAIFQTILSGGREHFLIGGIAREARLLKALRRLNRRVVGVRLTEGGSCRTHAVVSVDQPRPGEVANLILAAFTQQSILKLVTVVDSDVDIFDDEDVEWACSSRFQAQRDLLVVPNARGSSLDPSTDNGVTSKMGMDATIPPDSDRARYARMRIPNLEGLRLEDYLR